VRGGVTQERGPRLGETHQWKEAYAPMNQEDDRLAQVLEELAALLRVGHHASIRDLLRAEIGRDAARRAYVATDGASTQQQVAQRSGLSQPRISRLWRRWIALGLAVETTGGRAKALFDLSIYDGSSSAVAANDKRGVKHE